MNDSLPDSDHVLRYCSPIHITKETIKASAFGLRSNEEFLSVNWMEYFDKPVKQQVDAIRVALGKKLELKPKGRFARLRVETVKTRLQGAKVKHLPEDEDPSHAGIYIAWQNNRETTLELANMIESSDIFPALEKI